MLHMCSLNSGICKSYHTHTLSVIFFQKPSVSLSHKFLLVCNSFIDEEVVKIFITA